MILNIRDRDDLLDQMAELMADGFAQKFTSIIGSGDKFHESAKIIFNRELSFAYLEDNILKGIAILKDKKTHPVISPFNKLRKVLGFFGAIKAKISLFFIFGFDKVDSETLKLEFLSVSQKYRGQGIGSKLIEQTEKYAKDMGFKTLTLDVIDSNPRAKKLYEDFGFVEAKYIDTSKMTKDLGFTGIHQMDKKL